MDDRGDALTVAGMAAATGVSGHTLRYYEREGLLRPVARTSGNQRRYSAADIEWVAFLLRLRDTGMPIAAMRVYAEHRQQGPSTTEQRLRMLDEHRNLLREKITRLQGHESALADKTAIYREQLRLRTTTTDG